MNFSRTQRAAAAAWLCLALTACGGGGSGDNDPAALPPALSVALPASVAPGASLALATNATEAVGLSYAWDFGDGGTSAEAAPSHTWAAPGRYTVTVTVTNNAGEARNFSATVTVGQLANVAGLVCSEANDAGWCWQRPLPTGNPVNAVAMIDATTGWAVGERGTLLKTADGGVSWQAVAGPSDAALADVAFADAQHGWAIAADGSIWRTDDSGVRWAAVALNADNGDNFAIADGRLRVLGASRVLAGNSAAMVASVDGGITWRRTGAVPDAVTPNGTFYIRSGGNGELQRSTDFGQTFETVFSGGSGLYYTFGSAVSFSDDANGWFVVSGYDPSYNVVTRVWRTTDGGSSWTQATGAGLPVLWSAVQLRTSGQNAWIWDGNAGVYRSTDGGAQWTGITPPVWSIRSVSFLDDSTLFVTGYGGSYVSTDAGAHWIAVTPPDEFDGFSGTEPVFRRAGGVWLLQYGPRVYRSTNQAANWVRVLGTAPDEADTALRSIWFTDAAHGWAASDGGVLLRTTDGGRQWTAANVGVAGRRSTGPLQFIDANIGWLLLGDDTVARTTDGGANWSVPATSTPPASVTAIHFLDANQGWAIGQTEANSQTGALWRTTDGGTRWTATPLPSLEYNAVAFADASTGLLVGGTGRILRTTDGGATWTAVASGVPSQAFYRVRFTSATEGWIVGSRGTLLHSTDAGASWRAVPTLPTFSHFRDLRFADAKIGWVVGDGGTILATRDGGQTWSVQASGTARDLHSIFATDGSTAWIGGADGLVLATAFGGGR